MTQAIIILLLIVCQVDYISAKGKLKLSNVKYSVQLKDLWCKHNPDYAQETNITCNVKLNKEKVPILNFRATLKKEIKDVKFKVTVNYKYDDYRPLLSEYVVDYCTFIKGTFTSVVMKIFIDNARPYTKNIHDCPFKVGEVIALKDLQLNFQIVPLIVPSGDYRVDYVISDGKNTTYLVAKCYASISGLGKLG